MTAPPLLTVTVTAGLLPLAQRVEGAGVLLEHQSQSRGTLSTKVSCSGTYTVAVTVLKTNIYIGQLAIVRTQAFKAMQVEAYTYQPLYLSEQGRWSTKFA